MTLELLLKCPFYSEESNQVYKPRALLVVDDEIHTLLRFLASIPDKDLYSIIRVFVFRPDTTGGEIEEFARTATKRFPGIKVIAATREEIHDVISYDHVKVSESIQSYTKFLNQLIHRNGVLVHDVRLELSNVDWQREVNDDKVFVDPKYGIYAALNGRYFYIISQHDFKISYSETHKELVGNRVKFAEKVEVEINDKVELDASIHNYWFRILAGVIKNEMDRPIFNRRLVWDDGDTYLANPNEDLKAFETSFAYCLDETQSPNLLFSTCNEFNYTATKAPRRFAFLKLLLEARFGAQYDSRLTLVDSDRGKLVTHESILEALSEFGAYDPEPVSLTIHKIFGSARNREHIFTRQIAKNEHASGLLGHVCRYELLNWRDLAPNLYKTVTKSMK